jgi:transposase
VCSISAAALPSRAGPDEQGLAGLASGPRGPTLGTGRFLEAEQEAEVRALISRHTPDDLGLPFALWSRAAVRELIERHCGVRLAVRTMSTDLARWGFTAQKPLRRAYEPSPKAVRHWGVSSPCGASQSREGHDLLGR